MKTILINMLAIIYVGGSLFILLMAIMFPFAYGMKGFPNWIGWPLYPITLLVCASQQACLNYFDKKQKAA